MKYPTPNLLLGPVICKLRPKLIVIIIRLLTWLRQTRTQLSSPPPPPPPPTSPTVLARTSPDKPAQARRHPFAPFLSSHRAPTAPASVRTSPDQPAPTRLHYFSPGQARLRPSKLFLARTSPSYAFAHPPPWLLHRPNSAPPCPASPSRLFTLDANRIRSLSNSPNARSRPPSPPPKRMPLP